MFFTLLPALFKDFSIMSEIVEELGGLIDTLNIYMEEDVHPYRFWTGVEGHNTQTTNPTSRVILIIMLLL